MRFLKLQLLCQRYSQQCKDRGISLKNSHLSNQIVYCFSIIQIIHLNFCFRHTSRIIISYFFFLSRFDIVGFIIGDCCSVFRRWLKDGIKKVEMEWMFFISISLSVLLSFVFIFVQVMCHINRQNWLAVIHQHEWSLLFRRMSTNAMSKKDPLNGHISGLSSKTFTKEFFIIRFWRSINPFG